MSAVQSINDTTIHVEFVWSRLKFPTLRAATEVCGLSKIEMWRPETWWWNEQVDQNVVLTRKAHVSRFIKP